MSLIVVRVSAECRYINFPVLTLFCTIVQILVYTSQFSDLNKQGVRLELCACNRVGLLSDITLVLRENGLAVVRADTVTHGEKAVNAFYVRDISGNNVDMNFKKSMKREMGSIDLAVKDETTIIRPTSSGRSNFSIGYMLKSQIERFSHNFVAI